jgi:endonuclease YncB( thermonuclease family)
VLDLACVGVRAPRGQRETIEGVATVLDGDTIEVGGVRVRLEGLHCPEARERGGSAATSAMRGLTSGQHVSCSLTGERSYDRLIGTFYVGDGDPTVGQSERAPLAIHLRHGRACFPALFVLAAGLEND